MAMGSSSLARIVPKLLRTAVAALSLSAGVSLLCPAGASAATYVLDYDILKENDAANKPAGTAPWLRATISGPDTLTNAIQTVTIKLESLLQNSNEFFGVPSRSQTEIPTDIGFNFQGILPSDLQALCSNTVGDGCLVGSVGSPSYLFNIPNGIDLPGNAYTGFDLALILAPPPVDVRFGFGDTITYAFSGTGLTASQFITVNSPKDGSSGQFCSAAMVQATGTNNEGSNVIGAPCPGTPPSSVPGPLPLLGAGLAFGFSRRLRRRIESSASLPANGSVG